MPPEYCTQWNQWNGSGEFDPFQTQLTGVISSLHELNQNTLGIQNQLTLWNTNFLSENAAWHAQMKEMNEAWLKESDEYQILIEDFNSTSKEALEFAKKSLKPANVFKTALIGGIGATIGSGIAGFALELASHGAEALGRWISGIFTDGGPSDEEKLKRFIEARETYEKISGDALETLDSAIDRSFLGLLTWDSFLSREEVGGEKWREVLQEYEIRKIEIELEEKELETGSPSDRHERAEKIADLRNENQEISGILSIVALLMGKNPSKNENKLIARSVDLSSIRKDFCRKIGNLLEHRTELEGKLAEARMNLLNGSEVFFKTKIEEYDEDRNDLRSGMKAWVESISTAMEDLRKKAGAEQTQRWEKLIEACTLHMTEKMDGLSMDDARILCTQGLESEVTGSMGGAKAATSRWFRERFPRHPHGPEILKNLQKTWELRLDSGFTIIDSSKLLRREFQLEDFQFLEFSQTLKSLYGRAARLGYDLSSGRTSLVAALQSQLGFISRILDENTSASIVGFQELMNSRKSAYASSCRP